MCTEVLPLHKMRKCSTSLKHGEEWKDKGRRKGLEEEKRQRKGMD